MQAIEIVVIIAAVAIVLGVAVGTVVKKRIARKKGVPACCSGCESCPHCKACKGNQNH